MNRLIYVNNYVVKGFGRGSKELGCPTANIAGIDHLTISTGIYCGLVQLVIEKPDQVQEEPGNSEHYERILGSLPYVSPVTGMVCSFGFNPQYGNKEKSLEVHILDDIEFNFYGSKLRVLICKKMRDEEKYNSLDELKNAIANDIKNASAEVANYQHLATDDQYFLHPGSQANNHNDHHQGNSNNNNHSDKKSQTNHNSDISNGLLKQNGEKTTS